MRACMVLCMLAAGAVTLTSVRAAAWWESTVVYQIYPRSFKDSDGDGIGDLNGITSKLDYLKDLGVDAIWLSPIYKSPMFDFGYDITDYKAIDEIFGTMEDFDRLLNQTKSRGIRIVLDFVPNHTGHLSYWFEQSVKQNGTYTDYYIWADAKKNATGSRVVPNNWVSMFSKSAWTWNEERGQYYLHQFAVQQPDLNYRNADLRNDMKAVLRFWLDKGVSGFRVDAVNFLYEVEATNGLYPDEPLSNATGYGPDDYEYLLHPYTVDRDETYGVVYDWRAVLDEYTSKSGESKILMTESYTDIEHMIRYYSNGTRDGSIPFNFIFLKELTKTSTATDMKTVIDKWLNNIPAGKTANWVNGNHDQSRLATRLGDNRVDAMNMLALLLPGVTITYQGEELGMTDGTVSWAQTVDPQACNTDDSENYASKSRDPERTPFHWDSTANAGFTTGSTTWLPVASNYLTVNVAVEQAAAKSHLKFYKDVVALKHTSPVSSGTWTTNALSDTVMVVVRWLSDEAVVGVINLASTAQDVNLSSVSNVPEHMKVSASGVQCSLDKGAEVTKDKITMPAYCALALQNNTTTVPDAASKVTTASFLVYCILYILYAAV